MRNILKEVLKHSFQKSSKLACQCFFLILRENILKKGDSSKAHSEVEPRMVLLWGSRANHCSSILTCELKFEQKKSTFVNRYWEVLK